MKQFIVTGMSCAACSARVEKAVSSLPGVESCMVNLLTGDMGVEGEATAQEIIGAVVSAGYGASVKETGNSESMEKMLKDHDTPILMRRLLLSVPLLIILMYFSMGYMMFGFPLPSFMVGKHVVMGLVQMVLTIMIMVINRKFFVSGFKSLFSASPNMDTLVSLGATAAFGYSLYALGAMAVVANKGDMDRVMYYMDQLYFESAATILTLITVGKMLEARSKGKTTDALKGLMKLAPKQAVVLREEKEITLPIEEVRVGDIFLVKPGENIPVDGVVVDGSSAINEASLTGESIPVDKQAGDKVTTGTINLSGFLKCRATHVGEDTALSQIIRMVSDAAATKAPIAKVADRVSGVFVPIVMGIAAVTFIVWMLTGAGFGYALARAISVLVISCPCALGLATPVAIMVGNGVGAKNGIMFKTAVSLEETGKADIVVLDKTGTITTGIPMVTEVVPMEDCLEEVLLEYAYACEQKSEHPLAMAIREYCQQKKVELKETEEFKILPGNGLVAMLNGESLYAGNERFIKTKVFVSQKAHDLAVKLSTEGKTPLFFAKGEVLLGIIAVADTIKEDSREAVEALKNLGLFVVMLTGDNERTALSMGEKAGVDRVIADVLPEGKEEVIRILKESGRVIMVGDGINDAPALTRADMGIAIGAGSDIAIDAADVVLMKNSLKDVAAAIRLSRSTLKNIYENLFWAFFYNTIGIPLAAGVFIPLFSWELNPMFGAAAMSLSSFCVVTNALRLNLCKIHDGSKDKRRKKKIEINENSLKDLLEKKADLLDNYISEVQEEKCMEKTMTIEGMMCGHCEARVKKTLEALEGVKAAEVSHEKGTAVVSMEAEIADDVLKQAVEAQDYKVVSIN